MGRVLNVRPITSGSSAQPNGTLTVDILLNDMTTFLVAVPLILAPGRARNLRAGMQVAVTYPWGSTQYPVAYGRMITPTGAPGAPSANVPGYIDPLPAANEYPDDDVWEHPETGAFMRFRNTLSSALGGPGSTANDPLPCVDGGPCHFTFNFASGFVIELIETASVAPIPGETPTPPDSATVTITLPGGAGTATITQPTLTTGAIGISLNTALGTISSVLDGHAQTITHTASTATGPATMEVNAVTQQISHTVGTVAAIVDGNGNTISLVPIKAAATGVVALGDVPANLSTSANAAYNISHITTFENNLWSKRFDDASKFAAAMIAASVPNASNVLANLATLLHVPIPAGAPSTLIKTS